MKKEISASDFELDTEGANASAVLKNISKFAYKAKEYIDKGNKVPTNKDEFNKFTRYISKGSTDDI